MIDRNHPAVDAAERAATRWMEDRELETDLDGTVYMLTAAIPHLTADDLRGTPAGQALIAEAKREVAYGLECIATGHDWTGNEEAARCCRATAKALLHAFPKEGNR